MTKTYRNQAYYLVSLQAFVALIISLAFLLLDDTKSAYSALLGGVVCVIPSLYFALRLFAWSRGGLVNKQALQQYTRSIFVGEVTKILLAAMLLILVISFIDIVPLAFFLNYLASQLAFWLAPLMFLSRFR